MVPTPVGVNRRQRMDREIRASGPHARGGEPTAINAILKALEWSPRPWG